MKIRSLELRNYRRHHRTFIEWPDGVMAVLGRNGSGKSTLLESIGFALFGVPATRTGKDLLRWDGAGPMDSMGVALEFELAGEAIRVHRELRGKGLTPSATLTVDGRVAVDPGAGSNEAVTAEIERRFGMDRDTFFTTLVAQQGDLDRLAGMTPARRKQFLLEMLGIDALDQAIDAARQKRRDLENQVEAIRKGLPDHDALKAKLAAAKQALAEATAAAKVAEESWANCKTALAATVTELETLRQLAAQRAIVEARVVEATQHVEAMERDLKRVGAQRDAAQAAAKKVDSLRVQADALPELESQWQAVQRARENARRREALEKRLHELDDAGATDLATAEEELAAIEEQLEAAQQALAVAASRAQADADHVNQLQSLGDAAECPTCLRPLDDHVPALAERLRESARRHDAVAKEQQALQKTLQEKKRVASFAVAASKERVAVQQQLEQVPGIAASEGDALEQRLAASRAAHEERLKLHGSVEALPALSKEKQGLEQSLQDARKTLEDAQQQLENLEDPGPKLASVQAQHDAQASAERDAERAVLGARSAIELAKKDVAAATARLDDYQKQTKRLKETEDEGRYWAALASGRGRGMLEAFKAHLVARIGPAIGREASRLLERFTGGRYTEVTLDSEYNVFVSDGGTRYSLNRFSGGESDLVHLAMRLAVSRMLVERSAAEMRFLALDEVFGGLDEERRHLVLAALQELGSLYSQVMLVTHHEGLRDALDASLEVTERDGAAHVALHAG